MPSQKEISRQHELLAMYRDSLAHYLKQQALHGAANTPLNVLNGIDETRNNIQRVKRILREWHVSVESHPDDGDDFSQNTAAQPQPSSATPDRVRLLQVLTTYFSDDELRELCFILNIDYESLAGVGKSGKARELVGFVERRGRLTDLVEHVRAARSNIIW